MDKVNAHNLFNLFLRELNFIHRGHRLKRGERFKRDARGKSFTERVVCIWNRVPEQAIEVVSIVPFKRHLDR